MKFKIGDNVKVVKTYTKLKDRCKDKNYTIIGIDDYMDKAYLLSDNSPFRWYEDELELVKDNKKFFKTLPNNYTGTIEVANGYIVEKEILDEAEKNYLKAVIRPFKNRVIGILKNAEPVYRKYYISIELNDDSIVLPFFKEKTMYKGMEINKKYTLKELGLDE